MSEAIEISNLAFAYPGQPPLIRGLGLKVRQGTRFGLFGPNGAGKTTLMGLMTGLLAYHQGSVQLLGSELKDHQQALNRRIGLVPQDFAFYEELSPAENLAFFGAWYGMPSAVIREKTRELLGLMGLQQVADKPVRQFSGGMKRRVNLAIGVIHQPELLFLDEPTVGVDVQSRNAIVAYLKSINAAGTTLVYTSHQLQEAEDLCQDIALIDQGEIISSDSLSNLLATHRQEGLEGLFLELTGRAYRD
ncbi:ABC transporter ATP-binding protein [Niabella terrae]